MRRPDFEAMVAGMKREVPPHFLDGVDAIEVTGKTVPHPLRAEVFTLGECDPRSLVGDEGPELHSRVFLHYGSFAALARITDGFDWRHEAWETLTHELRHHLEWRARVPALEALDDAVEANYARHDGEPFPSLFHLDGEPIGPGVTRVEDDVFIDAVLSGREWRRIPDTGYRIRWHGAEFTVQLPAQIPDILYLTLEGLTPEPAGDAVLVIRRRPGLRDLWHRAVTGQASASVTRSNRID